MGVYLLESRKIKVYAGSDSIPEEVLRRAVREEEDILIVARDKDYLDKIVRRQVSSVVRLDDVIHPRKV